jgi:hypothetical protein
MNRTVVAMIVCALAVTVTHAQSPKPKAGATVYIAPTDDGFQTYITAAILKKRVPLSVVTNPDNATYRLEASNVATEQVTTGHKVINCLFAYCAGNENKASTSATMTDGAGTVVWSYSVNKQRGSKNLQSMAEAIAKHLGDDIKK